MEKIFVLIKVEPGRVEEVLGHITEKRLVKEACAVTGSYDIIVKIQGASMAEMLSTVVGNIHKIEGVMSTETMVSVEL